VPARITARNQEKYVCWAETSMHVFSPLALVFPPDVFSHAPHVLNGPIRLGEQVLAHVPTAPTRGRYDVRVFG
jgi:hypothetical protein